MQQRSSATGVFLRTALGAAIAVLLVYLAIVARRNSIVLSELRQEMAKAGTGREYDAPGFGSPSGDSGNPVAAERRPAGLAAVTLGVNYCTWADEFGSDGSLAAMRDLKRVHVTKIMFVPTWYQKDGAATSIHRIEGKTPADDGIVKDIQRARDMGFTIGLKFHVDPEDGTPRSNIRFDAMGDFETWFADYRKIALHYAKMGRSCGVDWFSIGCEMSGVTTHAYTKHWRDLIAEVRRILDAGDRPPVRLTYSARHQSVVNIEFWNDLDYVGINTWPYFPKYDVVSTANVREGWRRAIYFSETFGIQHPAHALREGYALDFFDFVRLVGKHYGKPIVLTEFGCQSKEGVLARPVDWWTAGNPDALVQIYFFTGFFEELAEDMRAFAKQNPGKPYPLAGIDIWNYMVKEGGPKDTDYTFRNKPVEDVFRAFFESGKKKQKE